jgi:DNA-binding GntR family transcriptional regulator
MVILEQEGLVTIKPRSGVYVRTFTPEEIVDLLLVEGSIETLAIVKAAKRIQRREIINLEALHHLFEQTPEPTAKEFRSYDRKFHSAIIKSSHSAILMELLTKQLSQIYLSRFYTATVPGRIAHSLKEHSAILESLRKHDPDRALASLQHHIERAVEDFCQNG